MVQERYEGAGMIYHPLSLEDDPIEPQPWQCFDCGAKFDVAGHYEPDGDENGTYYTFVPSDSMCPECESEETDEDWRAR